MGYWLLKPDANVWLHPSVRPLIEQQLLDGFEPRTFEMLFQQSISEPVCYVNKRNSICPELLEYVFALREWSPIQQFMPGLFLFEHRLSM